MIGSDTRTPCGFAGTFASHALLSLLAPALLSAGGCASYLNAQVTSFQNVSPQHPLTGRRFLVEPTVEQKESLEYRAYAELVSRALVDHGLVDATSSGNAELAVSVRYSVDGRPVTNAYPEYGYANFGPVWGWAPYRVPGGGISYAWTATYPVSYGTVGTNYASAVRYRRKLEVEISERVSGKKRLYEGSVVSEGASASLAPVMPAMIRALFHDFPGTNGRSRIVQVLLDPQQ